MNTTTRDMSTYGVETSRTLARYYFLSNMKVLNESELQRILKFNVTQIKQLTFLPFCHTSRSHVRKTFNLAAH